MAQVDARVVSELAGRLVANVEKVVVGKRDVIRLAVCALLADGHVLFEDVPGVAKTMLARSLALSLGCSFARLQCTPDLLPSDITGVYVFNQRTSEFEFRPGPVIHNILLADEINRATPRAQSALLEAMAERQVSVDGNTFELARPFMVMATQNPIEFEGTFPLPEAQLDRFLVKLTIGYPGFAAENDMLEMQRSHHPIESLQAVASSEELLTAQEVTRSVRVHEAVRQYIVRIVHATRSHADLAMGASPRASLALYRSAQAMAATSGRGYVLPDDVKYLAWFVLPHRLIMSAESRLRGRAQSDVVEEILEQVPAPKPAAKGE
ncbi:MAG: AAA family ATPase [Armatimonadota bacterium]